MFVKSTTKGTEAKKTCTSTLAEFLFNSIFLFFSQSLNRRKTTTVYPNSLSDFRLLQVHALMGVGFGPRNQWAVAELCLVRLDGSRIFQQTDKRGPTSDCVS